MRDSRKLALLKQLEKHNIKTCQIHHGGKNFFEYARKEALSKDILPINSCTKSITSLLVGICLELGYFDDVEQAFWPLLDVQECLQMDPLMKSITIHQLLTMTSGIKWDESKDWHIFKEDFEDNVLSTILAKEVTSNLNGYMNYSSADSYLLSALIQKVSGKTTEAFAKEYLFKALGITAFYWPKKQGINLGSHGMLMKADDLMKIGIMYLGGGIYDKKQVLSKNWIDRSTQAYSKATRVQGGYGYHWWVMDDMITPTQSISFYFAMGYGGQVLIVVPSLELVTVMTRNIDKNTNRSIEIFRHYILKEFI